MGIPVFYADEETKKLYDSEIVLSFFKQNYGDSFFTNQKLDISKLADYIFKNDKNRKEIETFIHPLVMQQFDAWATQQSSNIVMLESAIIFEAALEKFFDKIIVVDAPIAVRMKRIKDRNPHLSESEILHRINVQIPQEEKCKRGDLVIDNSD